MVSKINYQRQTGIINIKRFRDNEIAIIGCGAIGSFLGMSLAKMGLTKFVLVDFDRVESHNLPNQFFKEEDLGVRKSVATYNNMHDFNSDVQIKARGSKFKPYDIKNSHIVVSCVDSMKVRKQIFNACKKNKNIQLFIDTRMGGLEGQIYFIEMNKKKEIKNYEKTLFTDEQASQLRCTERSIIFTVLGIVSFVCNQIVKALNEEKIRNYIVLDYKIQQMI